MEEIEEESEEIEPTKLFPDVRVEVTLLFKQPNNERWKKLSSQAKKDAKAYTLTSRFVPASEAVDGISCHDDFAGTARLYDVSTR